MKPIALAIVTFLLFSGHVMAQSESGTLVVLNSSQGEIAVAADSRSHNSITYTDNRCKISALGNDLIFAASGKTGYGPLGGGDLIWDAHAIVRDVFRALAHDPPQSLPLTVATRWGSEVKTRLQFDLVHHRDETLSGIDGDTLTSAIFAGFNSEGISIVVGQITYRFTAEGQPLTTFTIRNNYEKPTAVFIGDTEIADEFTAGTTARAVEWRRDASSLAMHSQDDILFFAMRLVDLSIAHHPGKIVNGRTMPTIGGPVDALRLVRGRRLEWIQRKQNCTEN